MRKTVRVALFIGLLMIPSLVVGEVYRWVDENGGVHFTDDYSTIPEKYRQLIEKRTLPKDSSPKQPIQQQQSPSVKIDERRIRLFDLDRRLAIYRQYNEIADGLRRSTAGSRDRVVLKVKETRTFKGFPSLTLVDLNQDGKPDQFLYLPPGGGETNEHGFIFDLNKDGKIDYVVFNGGPLFTNDMKFVWMNYHMIDSNLDGKIDIEVYNDVNLSGGLVDEGLTAWIYDTDFDGKIDKAEYLGEGINKPVEKIGRAFILKRVMGEKEISESIEDFFDLPNTILLDINTLLERQSLQETSKPILKKTETNKENVKSGESSGRVIDAGNFTIEYPPGEGWKIEVVRERGLVKFQKVKMNPLGSSVPPVGITQIKVFKNFPQSERLHFSEKEIADDFRNLEENYMIDLGVKQGQYSLKNVKKGLLTLEGKKLYFMSYEKEMKTRGTQRGAMEDWLEEAVLYLHFPAEFAENHLFYCFLISQLYQKHSKSGIASDLKQIYPVINSFKIVNP